MSKKTHKLKYILYQLINHLPFSLFGVMISIIVMGFLTFIAHILQAQELVPSASEELFHVFHASHVLISAVASTAMFRKHDGHLFKAIFVGIVGSITICGISDIFFPYIGGIFLRADMHCHICLIEEPQLVYPFALIGTIAGLGAHRSFEKATEYSHSFHVFVSSLASLLYLMAFGLTDWTHAIGAVLLITVFAVMLPCCLSDIAFPLMCSHSHCQHPDIMDQEHAH